MRKLIAVATVAVASAALAVPALAATKPVKIGDNWFISNAKNKGTVKAKVGDTVKWTWVGKFPHNVKTSSGPVKINSGAAKKSGSYSKKLTKAGTYKIFCGVHTAAAQSMTLKVSK